MDGCEQIFESALRANLLELIRLPVFADASYAQRDDILARASFWARRNLVLEIGPSMAGLVHDGTPLPIAGHAYGLRVGPLPISGVIEIEPGSTIGPEERAALDLFCEGRGLRWDATSSNGSFCSSPCLVTSISFSRFDPVAGGLWPSELPIEQDRIHAIETAVVGELHANGSIP